MLLINSGFTLFLFVGLGAIVGSFLNVVILRLHTGRSFVSGRSLCFHCNHQLASRDLVPILSFIFLKGRCRFCHSRLSWQYPLVETLTALIFALIFLKEGLTLTWLFNSVVFAILIVIVGYDMRHKIIPDGMVFIFIVLGIFKTLIQPFSVWPDLFSGLLLFLPFFIVWYLSKGEWIGFGDAKLAVGMGYFLGLSAGGAAILLAFWLGAIVGVILLILGMLLKDKKFGMKTAIPFAPFLILGTFITYYCQLDFSTILAGISHFLP